MSKLHELMVKGLYLKTRVALLGAPMGNKNAAGPHDGIISEELQKIKDERRKVLDRRGLTPGLRKRIEESKRKDERLKSKTIK